MSDKKKGIEYPVIKVPADCYFENFLKLRNKKDIGAQTNIKNEKIAKANDLTNVINNVSFNDDNKLAQGSSKVELLSNILN